VPIVVGGTGLYCRWYACSCPRNLRIAQRPHRYIYGPAGDEDPDPDMIVKHREWERLVSTRRDEILEQIQKLDPDLAKDLLKYISLSFIICIV
jgi:tRNA A37 N6-isopentenylltransferase MiaA